MTRTQFTMHEMVTRVHLSTYTWMPTVLASVHVDIKESLQVPEVGSGLSTVSLQIHGIERPGSRSCPNLPSVSWWLFCVC